MSVTKYIKEILQEKFENIGFQYHKSAPSEWEFIRLGKGYKEYIVIDKSGWEKNAIRCTFITYEKSISSTKLTEGNILEWYSYQDTEELKQILHLMGDITERYALDWFKKNMPEMDLLPDNFLEEAWREKIENFIRIHQIQLEESDFSIAKLDGVLKGKVSREEMYAISYCFGEIIRKQFGADWDFSEETGPYIRNIAGDYTYVSEPFALVHAVISDPFETSLQEYFNIIRDIVDRLYDSN